MTAARSFVRQPRRGRAARGLPRQVGGQRRVAVLARLGLVGLVTLAAAWVAVPRHRPGRRRCPTLAAGRRVRRAARGARRRRRRLPERSDGFGRGASRRARRPGRALRRAGVVASPPYARCRSRRLRQRRHAPGAVLRRQTQVSVFQQEGTSTGPRCPSRAARSIWAGRCLGGSRRPRRRRSAVGRRRRQGQRRLHRRDRATGDDAVTVAEELPEPPELLARPAGAEEPRGAGPARRLRAPTRPGPRAGTRRRSGQREAFAAPARRRCLRMRRRCRSELPPQTPWSMRCSRAYSRHVSLTGQVGADPLGDLDADAVAREEGGRRLVAGSCPPPSSRCRCRSDPRGAFLCAPRDAGSGSGLHQGPIGCGAM